MNVGTRIKELREAQGLTQKELANITKISNTFISDIEVGRCNPSLKTLMNIATALGVPCHELLDNKNQ